MSDLQAQFEEAQATIGSLTKDPGNAAKLTVYALFKQSTKGDAEGKRPGMTDFVGRAKFDEWAKHKGKSTDEAMQAYIDFANELKAKES